MFTKPIYEFLTWDNCSNNCSFCFQRKNPRIFVHESQKTIIDQIEKFITSNSFEKGSNVLIVGGELFDDIKRFAFLYPFFIKILSQMKHRLIDHLYVNTNLIYSEECCNEVKRIVSLFLDNDIVDKFHFTTSFDLAGRFKNEDDKIRYLKNLDSIRESFKKTRIIVNMILTNVLCKAILDGHFDLFKFIKCHDVDVNLIPYIILDKKLAPSRNLLYKTLNMIKDINPFFFRNMVIEHDLKQPRKMFYYQNSNWISCECPVSSCGHSVNFKRYTLDNDTCFVCDIKKIFEE